jgi:hypothetical protein
MSQLGRIKMEDLKITAFHILVTSSLESSAAVKYLSS